MGGATVRKPRDLADYQPVPDALRQLRKCADELEQRPNADGMVMRWKLDVSFWNPAWELLRKKKARKATRA
jgi:hypothetical protein